MQRYRVYRWGHAHPNAQAATIDQARHEAAVLSKAGHKYVVRDHDDAQRVRSIAEGGKTHWTNTCGVCKGDKLEMPMCSTCAGYGAVRSYDG